MVINKKLLRNGKANNLRFIGSVIVIAICVCMYVSFASSMWSLLHSVEKYRNENNYHTYFMTVKNEIPDISALEEKYDVIMEKRVYSELMTDDKDTIRLMSANEKVDTYIVTDGDDLSEPDDILLNRSYAEKNGYDIGSEIVIDSESYNVKGYFAEPDFALVTNSIKSISINHASYGIGLVSKERADRIAGTSTEYLIMCNDEESFDNQAFVKDVYMTSVVERFVHRDSDNRASYIDGDMLIYTKGMQIIPFFFMIVTSFVVAIILSKLLRSETVQIGIFYAFGYRNVDLYKHYISYALVISVMGSVLGIISGVLLAPVLKAMVTDRYSVPPFGISLELKTVVTAVVMPIVLLVSICSFFILSKLRLSPLQLLRNTSNEKKTVPFRSLELSRASFVNKFRVREILRNLPRYLFMIFGVCVSSVLLLVFASVLGSLNKMMDDSFSDIFKYEYMYTFSDMQIGEPDGYRTNINYLMLDGDEVSVNGVDVNNKHLCFNDTDGEPVTFEDNTITVNLANKHGIHAGDTVVLKNRYYGDEYEIRIDRITVSYAEDFISMPLDEFNEFFGFPKNSYVALTSDKALDIDSELLLSSNSITESRESIDETLKPVKYIMISMMVMAAFVSFILMVIIISIIVEDNRFSISLMKIFGYDDKRISKMLIDFNRYIVIIAFGLAIPLTLSAASGIMGYLSSMMGMYIPTYLDPLHAIIGFALLYIIFIIVKTIMKKNILSIEPAEVLKNGE